MLILSKLCLDVVDPGMQVRVRCVECLVERAEEEGVKALSMRADQSTDQCLAETSFDDIRVSISLKPSIDDVESGSQRHINREPIKVSEQHEKRDIAVLLESKTE